MKKIHLIFAVFSVSFAFAQTDLTGINTYNPKGILHVDGQGDNSAVPTEAEALNDFIVLPNGNVGVGTITPTNKLSIKTNGTTATPMPGLKIQDGSQGVNKVLKSDANGVASWGGVSISSGQAIEGVWTWTGLHLEAHGVNKIGYIDIPPGTHFIEVNLMLYLFAGNRGVFTIYIGEKDNGWNNGNTGDATAVSPINMKLYTSDETNSNTLAFFYNNTSGNTKRLYLNLISTNGNLSGQTFNVSTSYGTQVKSTFRATPLSIQ